MSRKAEEVSEISQVNLRAGWKEFTAVINLVSSFLVEDKNFEEKKFEKKFGVRQNVRKRTGVAWSHFTTHGYAISLFVIVATTWKAIKCKY